MTMKRDLHNEHLEGCPNRRPKHTARCVMCKHQWSMTQAQIDEARRDGMATCPKCYSPATVEKVSVRL